MASTVAAFDRSVDSVTNRSEGTNEGRAQTSPRPIPVPAAIDIPADDGMSCTSSQPSPRNFPLPNPPFVFPARQSPSSAPSSLSRASGHRPRLSIGSHENMLGLVEDTSDSTFSASKVRRPPPLPEFSFNPGAQPTNTRGDQGRSPVLPDFSFNPGSTSESDGSLLGSPLPPPSPHLAPNRGGHRRGGSEFVGGKLREGESITLMSTSPTRSDSGLASPTLAPVDVKSRRGRHAHRRSAAISSHDLSMILKPPPSPNASRGSSAPTSPADIGDQVKAFPDLDVDPGKRKSSETQTIQPANEANQVPLAEDDQEPEGSSKPTPRARVGFSDTLEYIPRPLSVVSTDTASTITARPGHSISGSISSIVSLSNLGMTDRDRPLMLASPISSKKGSDSRPSTAGAVLERTPSLLAITIDENSSSPRRRNSIPSLPQIDLENPLSPPTPSPTRTPKRWSFFGLEALTSSSMPSKQRPHSSSSSDTAAKASDLVCLPLEKDVDITEDDAELHAATKKSSGKKKKQKKVKSWAGSILTRKGKSRSQKTKSGGRRPQTPPPTGDFVEDYLDDDEMDIPAPLTAPMVMVTEARSYPEDSPPMKPRRKSEDDALYPMIDLDAALGPFNTPSGRDPAWDAAQKAGAAPRRQLHSAAGMRGFSGPGMHYHRRAESAPEMPPFEHARFIHRFGSSSTMADVFEEDEEDEDKEDASGAKSSSDESSTPDASGASAVTDYDAKSATDEGDCTPTQELDGGVKLSNETSATSLGRIEGRSSLDLQPPGPRVRMEPSSSSLHEEIIVEETPTHTALDQERIYETFQETDSAAPSPRRIMTNKDLAPVEIHPMSLPGPSLTAVSPYSVSHSSSFPSPRSPMSYDAHRVSTAPSSFTEENSFQSLLMGEPGPEVVRISVDVPSLTSSNSTMTRESNFPGVRPRNKPFHDQRPASFTSTAFGRRRSSLASLSRLISTSHGERSKLSMEVPLDPEPEKRAKISAAKRLSRMMQFWKTKDPATP
ncbi:hypothetical protein BX600DRAFT_508455 [Xylariales sp. PMI_506]|nr:hypothetical protein BX600DRAFT_508455 [Xylariales sp. PMI_506]